MYFQNNFSYEGLPVYRPIPAYDAIPQMVPQCPYAYSLYRQKVIFRKGLELLETLFARALRSPGAHWLYEVFGPYIEEKVARISGKQAGRAAREFVYKNATAIFNKLTSLLAVKTAVEAELDKQIFILLSAFFVGLGLSTAAADNLAQAFITIIWALAEIAATTI